MRSGGEGCVEESLAAADLSLKGVAFEEDWVWAA